MARMKNWVWGAPWIRHCVYGLDINHTFMPIFPREPFWPSTPLSPVVPLGPCFPLVPSGPIYNHINFKNKDVDEIVL